MTNNREISISSFMIDYEQIWRTISILRGNSSFFCYIAWFFTGCLSASWGFEGDINVAQVIAAIVVSGLFYAVFKIGEEIERLRRIKTDIHEAFKIGDIDRFQKLSDEFNKDHRFKPIKSIIFGP